MTNIWQIIVQSNTLNFFVVILLLLFVMIKLDIKGKIEKLRFDIKSYVDESAKEKEDAEKDLEEINRKVQNLPEEIEDIKLSAQKNIKSIASRLENEVEDKKKDIENNANRILNLEIKNFKSKLSAILSDASIDLSRKNAVEQLQNNRELHDKYIYDAINELDKVNL